MKWSYGVTTVQERVDNGYLLETLESLKNGGFENPILFGDGITHNSAIDLKKKTGLQVVNRPQKIRAVGNWILALWELMIRVPNADRYAIFQDDLNCVTNLRQYLERVPYPANSYLNLYTFPENAKLKPATIRNGFYKANQWGRGAVGLVFNRDSAINLVTHPHMAKKPNSKNGHLSIDGAISESMKRSTPKHFEYVHYPSLLWHIGKKSAIGNGPQSAAKSFPGKDFDALSFLQERKQPPTAKPVSKVKRDIGEGRIGLVGYNCASGLGEKNRQLATFVEVDRWLVKPHSSYKTVQPHPDVDTTVCPNGQKIPQWLNTVDIVLFDETPYYGSKLIKEIRKTGKRVVCIACMEWMPIPGTPWLDTVDLFICPTKQCFDLYKDELPCVYFPWPVDTDRFQFKQRTTVNKFLFLNGRGGWNGRKGASTIHEACRIWPEFPLIVRDQTNHQWPSTVEQLPKCQSNADLYSEGDVLVSPHYVDGTGLEQMEAMACGMPVINTQGLPWTELPGLVYIPATVAKKKIRRQIDWYTPDARALVNICKALIGKDISKNSKEAKEWADSMSFSKHAATLTDLIRYGKPTKNADEQLIVP